MIRWKIWEKVKNEDEKEDREEGGFYEERGRGRGGGSEEEKERGSIEKEGG